MQFLFTLFLCCGRSARGKTAGNYSQCVCRFVSLIIDLDFFVCVCVMCMFIFGSTMMKTTFD